jgi:hypothetical protein
MATQDQIDAAVAVVEAHATAAMGGVPDDLGYSSAHMVAKELEADPDQTREALDAEAGLVDDMGDPTGRIRGFANGQDVPVLDGSLFRVYGQTAYTTPELHEAARGAQAAAGEAEEAAVDEMALLYERGVVAGLPRPVMLRSSGPDDPGAVMYDAAGFKALVELAEGAGVSAQAASVGP